MNINNSVVILKGNLQLANSSNDEYLINLLNQAKAKMKREGIITDGTYDYDMAVIEYAAFLFRKRANLDASFPRSLRYDLNNILFSQKMKQ